MHLINDVDFKAALGRLIPDVLDNLSNLVDAAIRGAVDLVNIEWTPSRDLGAMAALVAGIRGGAALAIQGLRQDSRRGRLAHAPHTGKEVGMGDATRRYGIPQNTGDVGLADDIFKALGTPLAS